MTKLSLEGQRSRFITRSEWFNCYEDSPNKITIAVRNNGIIYVGLSSEIFHTEIMRRENLDGDIEYGYVVEI